MSDRSDLLVMLLGMTLAFASVAAVRVAMHLWGRYKFERAYRRGPRVVRYNQYQACPSSHRWQEFELALRDLAPGKYKVCMDCGAIAGNFEWMASNELLDQAAEVLRKRTEREELDRRVHSRVAAIVDHRVTEFILREFPRESSDPTFVNKTMELAEFVLTAREQAIEQVLTELEVGQVQPTDLGPMRGNA